MKKIIINNNNIILKYFRKIQESNKFNDYL